MGSFAIRLARWATASAFWAACMSTLVLAAQPPEEGIGVQAEVSTFPQEEGLAETSDSHGEGGEAEEAGEHGGSTNVLSADPDLAIFTAIVFLLMLLVLWQFAWGPISEALDRREQSVADQIAAARQSHEQAKQLLAEHQARLQGAAEEVRGMLDQARRDAEGQKQQILAEAQKAARAEKERAVREITAAKDQALHELAEKSVDTAVQLAGRIVRRQLRPADHAELIRDALEQFPSEN